MIIGLLLVVLVVFVFSRHHETGSTCCFSDAHIIGSGDSENYNNNEDRNKDADDGNDENVNADVDDGEDDGNRNYNDTDTT